MRKVITYGTFDMLHYGHINLLERAKKSGDYLIVALSTDEFNSLKNKKSFFDYKKRKKLLTTLKCVDEIIPEKSWEQKIDDIQEKQVDIFVMGDDWKGKFDFLNKYCKVKYLKRTPYISTTLIKSNIIKNND